MANNLLYSGQFTQQLDLAVENPTNLTNDAACIFQAETMRSALSPSTTIQGKTSTMDKPVIKQVITGITVASDPVFVGSTV